MKSNTHTLMLHAMQFYQLYQAEALCWALHWRHHSYRCTVCTCQSISSAYYVRRSANNKLSLVYCCKLLQQKILHQTYSTNKKSGSHGSNNITAMSRSPLEWWRNCHIIHPAVLLLREFHMTVVFYNSIWKLSSQTFVFAREANGWSFIR